MTGPFFSTLRSGSGPALPTSLSGLVAWGEADDLAGSDGSAVASWTNKTGSGIDPAQATAGNRPTIQANGINGLKSVKFAAASTQVLDFPAGALSWFNGVPGGTLMAVVQCTTLAAVMAVLNIGRNADAAGRLQMTVNTNGSLRTAVVVPDATSATATSAAGLIVAGVPNIVVCAANVATGFLEAYLNGALVASSRVPAPANFDATASNSVSIGGQSTAARLLDGLVSAYAIYPSYYSQRQWIGIAKRWSAKYNIGLAG